MAIFVVVVGENFFWLSKTIPSTMAVILRVEWFLKRHKRSFGRERGAKTLTPERQENFGNDENLLPVYYGLNPLNTHPMSRLPEVLSPKLPGELRAALESSLVFTVVRHPLTRLVSAYRSAKCQGFIFLRKSMRMGGGLGLQNQNVF